MSVATFAPTVEYDENGYSLDGSSDSWKSLCQNLPCSLSLQWPGYTTTKFEVILNGEPAVIQPWKGICPTPPGLPGGIGGEVGIYRRLPDKDIPTAFPGVPPAAERWLLDRVAWLTNDSDMWSRSTMSRVAWSGEPSSRPGRHGALEHEEHHEPEQPALRRMSRAPWNFAVAVPV